MKSSRNRLTRLLPAMRLPLLAIILLASLFVGLGVWAAVETKWAILPKRTAAPAAASPAAAKALNKSAARQRIGGKSPWLNLQAGHELAMPDLAASNLKVEAASGALSPLALAAADFNFDGYDDLITGYGGACEGGMLTLHRANKQAFAPTDEQVLAGIRRGEFPASFEAKAEVLPVPVAPDFLVSGRFTKDSTLDLVIASRQRDALYVLRSDGNGGFETPREIPVGGEVTALVTDSINGTKGLAGLVVATRTKDGFEAVLFDGSDDLLAATPQRLSLTKAVSSLALASPDSTTTEKDLFLLADGVISQIANISNSFVDPKPIALPFRAKDFALGEFIRDRQAKMELAVLSEDGNVSYLTRGKLDTRPFTTEEIVENWRRNGGRGNSSLAVKRTTKARKELSDHWTVAEKHQLGVSSFEGTATRFLQKAHITGNETEDLLVTDANNNSVQILFKEPNRDKTSFTSETKFENMDFAASPAAVLPMRLNVMGQQGFVIVESGKLAPTPVMFVPFASFAVTKTADTNDGTCDADCSLREAIVAANAAAGADIITFAVNGMFQLTIAGANENASATGDLDITQALTITGNGTANTIIQAGSNATNGIDKVLSFNPNFNAAFASSISGVTVRYGRNPSTWLTDGFGGGFDWDSFQTGTLTVSNVIVTDNSTLDGDGGGVVATSTPLGGSGFVSITGSTISNNKADRTPPTASPIGGGIFVGAVITFRLTNTVISNNDVTESFMNGQGGGIYAFGPASSAGKSFLTGSTVSGNIAPQDGGGIYSTQPIDFNPTTIISNNTTNRNGGGIWLNHTNGTTVINKATMTGNNANATGGAMYLGSTTMANILNVSFSRIVGNTGGGFKGLAVDGGTANVENNWWGCNTGPSAAPCDTAGVVGTGTVDFDPWLQLRLTASPNTTPVVGESRSLTASFLLNSAGGAVAASNLDALIGLPVTWSASGGTISGSQATIQPSATATATFTATAASPPNRTATAQVDNGPATVNFVVGQASTTTTITSDNPDPSVVGQTITVNYSVTVNAPGMGTPTGMVTVSDGVNSCMGTVAAGTCNVALTTAGARTLTATYPGDANFTGSMDTEPHQVNPATTTVSSINRAVADPVCSAAMVSWTVTFGAAVTGLSASNFTLANTGLSSPMITNVSGSGTTWTVTASTGSGSGMLGLNMTNSTGVTPMVSNLPFTGQVYTVNAPPTLTKSFTPNSITLGNTSTLQFTLSNPNTTQAINTLSFTDTLPSNVSAADVGPTTVCTNGSYSITGNVLTFSKPSLAAGGSCVFSITVTGVATGMQTNTTSTVMTSDSCTGTAASANITVTAVVDLAITKTNNVTSVNAGGTTTYTIVVSNNGPAPAGGAIFTDPVATGLTATSVTCGSETGSAVCPTMANTTVALMQGSGIVIPTLPSGGSVTFTVMANVTATSGSVTNTANIAPPAGTTDSDNTNDSANDMDTVIPVANLGITKTNGMTSVNAGGTTTYTIVVSNAGPSAAGGAVFTDPATTGLMATSVTCGSAMGGAACPTVANTTVALMQGSGIVIPTLPSGGSVTFTVMANVTATSGSVTNTANIAPPNGTMDLTPGNNSQGDTDTVTPVADLSVTKTDNSSTYTPGAPTIYTIVVSNAGPSDVTGATVSDNLPAQITSWTWVCSGSTGGATGCDGVVSSVANFTDTVNLPANSSITYTVTAQTSASATTNLVNTVTVTAPVGTTDAGGNNSATDTDTPSAQADLSITKTDSPDPVLPGNNITYTVTVTNSGSSDAAASLLSDAIPANTTFVSATTAGGWTRTDLVPMGGTGTLTFTNASFAPGAAVFTIVVTVNGATPSGSTITNTATVTSTTTDPTPGDHSATATTLVASAPQLTKSFTPSQIPVGQTSTLQFTINNANGFDLNDLMFTDSLPSGVTVPDSGPISVCGGAYSVASNIITFSNGSLAANSSCNFSVTVTGATFGQKSNTTSAIASSNAGTGMAATAALKVVAPPTLAKVFTPNNIPLSSTTSLDFTVTNPNTAGTTNVGLSGVEFTDVLPAGLTVANATINNPCGAGSTLTVTAATRTIALTNGSLGVSGTCNFSVTVTPTAAGAYTNTVNSIKSTEGGTNNTPVTAPLTVVAPPTIAKSFSPSSVPVGQVSTLTITITNPAANTVALTGVGFTDNFPANVTLVNPANATNTCGGMLTDSGGGTLTAGDTGIQLAGGMVGTSMPRTCTITVEVSPSAQGPHMNTIASVSSTEGGTNNTPASATLSTNMLPMITPADLTRTQGDTTANFTIANVSDAEDPATALTVQISNGGPFGSSATLNNVMVTIIGNPSAGGAVTASVTTPCNAMTATFTLQVTDTTNGSTTAAWKVTVNPNTPPTLSYANVAAGLNQTLTVNPATGPSDNGSITNLTVSASAGFTGTVAANLADGKVTINNAGPLGTHTITVKATDNCGEMTTTSFTLTVIPFLVKLSDPIICTGENNTLSVHAEVTNPNAFAANLNFNAPLPPPLSGVAGTCVVSAGTCMITANNITVTGLIPANQTVMIDYKVKVANGTPPGTLLCIDSTANFNGGPTAMVQACTTLNCPPAPANVMVSDQKAGSVLAFPYYISNAATKKDTRLTISHIGTQPANVHIFFIDGTSCDAADLFVCLTPNASFSFKTSEYDPEMTGWLLAVAVDNEGVPTRNNALIGNAFVVDGEYVDNYGAESFWAHSQALAVVNNVTATLFFDGGSYDAVPSQFAIELQSPVDTPGQRLVTVGLQGDLTTSQMSGASQVGTGLIYNGNEKPFGSFSTFLSGKCQAIATISTMTPRVPNGMHGMIPSGQVGSMKLNVGAGVGLLMTPRTTQWRGIRTLHKTALTTTTLTIPVVIPVC